MEPESNSIRLNKAISDSGYCSRRQADKLIETGRVKINGLPAQLGDKVTSQDEITVDDKPIKERGRTVYIAFNKPVGITCTGDKRVADNVIDYINHPERIFYIGRLDKMSEGLLLLTNDGDVVNKILRAGNKHDKEYLVTVDKPIDAHFIQRMSSGVAILDTITQPCKVEATGKKSFRIILQQGLNRQIRRMCEALGYTVQTLKRVRIMHIELGDLQVGAWRDLSEPELKTLQQAISGSENRSMAQVRSTVGKRRKRK
jgi:23S rRNA pseudouridine2604 synthase